MATTPDAVVTALVTALEAVAPTTLAAEHFDHYDGELEFEEFCALEPAHCFRRFDLEHEPGPRAPLVSNGDATVGSRWRKTFTLTVAYPRARYKASLTTPMAIKRAIDEDEAKIVPVLRDYTGAAWVSEEADFRRERVGEVVFLRITSTFEFWRIP